MSVVDFLSFIIVFFHYFALTAPLSGHFSSLQLFNTAVNSYCCVSRSSCRRECRSEKKKNSRNYFFSEERERLFPSQRICLEAEPERLNTSGESSFVLCFFFGTGGKIHKMYVAVSLPQCHHNCVPALLVWQLADNYEHPEKKNKKTRTK